MKGTAALRPVVRSYQDEIERERRIPPALVEQLGAAGLYRMAVPRSLGGGQVDLLSLLRALQLVAEGDGSVGWNLANTVAFDQVVLSLPDAGVEDIFAHGPDVGLSGAIGPRGGRAVAVDGGYVTSGRWRFGSGCREAGWLCGNCELFDEDQPRRAPDGSSLFVRAFFPVADCAIIDTWDATGLRGTGSHDWAVTKVFVPERRTCVFAASEPSRIAGADGPGRCTRSQPTP